MVLSPTDNGTVLLRVGYQQVLEETPCGKRADRSDRHDFEVGGLATSAAAAAGGGWPVFAVPIQKQLGLNTGLPPFGNFASREEDFRITIGEIEAVVSFPNSGEVLGRAYIHSGFLSGFRCADRALAKESWRSVLSTVYSE